MPFGTVFHPSARCDDAWPNHRRLSRGDRIWPTVLKMAENCGFLNMLLRRFFLPFSFKINDLVFGKKWFVQIYPSLDKPF